MSGFHRRVAWAFAQMKNYKAVETKPLVDAGGTAYTTPQAALSEPVTAIIGRQRVKNPNVIWFGNPQPIKETETVEEEGTEENTNNYSGTVQKVTTITTTKITRIVGYKVDMIMAICLGPGIRLRGIYNDDKEIWSGNVGPARSVFTLPVNDSFMSGCRCIFRGGAFDQTVDPEFVGIPDSPAYVGICYILLKGMRADLTFGDLSFEVDRIPNPLGLSNANNQIGVDINAATVIAEMLTNEWGFGAASINDIDVAKFTSMALTLKAENNGASVRLDGEADIGQLVGAVQNQISGSIFHDPETGKISGNLTRQGNVNYITSKRFNHSNIVDLRDYNKAMWPSTFNQIRADYVERQRHYSVASVFAQDQSALFDSGRSKRTAVLQYPFVTNGALAQKLAGRDLGIVSSPLITFTLVTNRDGANLKPGEIILVTWDDLGLVNFAVEVVKVRKSPIEQNNVVVTVSQVPDPPDNSVISPPVIGVDPDLGVDPISPSVVRFIDAPWWFLRTTIDNISRNVSPIILPTPANAIQASFDVFLHNRPGSAVDIRILTEASYPTTCKLILSISKYDGFNTGFIPSLVVNNVVNDSYFDSFGAAGIRQGRILAFLGNEIISFTAATDNGDGTWTLTNVYRGLIDTVAQDHAAGASLYIVGNDGTFVSSSFAFPVGYTPEWYIYSNSATKDGHVSNSNIFTSWSPPSEIRNLSPPRPHHTRINATARSNVAFNMVRLTNYTVSWLTRHRADNVIPLQTDAARNGELQGSTRQIHRVWIEDSLGGTHDLGATSPSAYANALVVNIPNTVPVGAGWLWVEAEMAMPDGNTYKSLQQDKLPITIA